MDKEHFDKIFGVQMPDPSDETKRAAALEEARLIFSCLETEAGKIILAKIQAYLAFSDAHPEDFLQTRPDGGQQVNVTGVSVRAGQRLAFQTLLQWFGSAKITLEREAARNNPKSGV